MCVLTVFCVSNPGLDNFLKNVGTLVESIKIQANLMEDSVSDAVFEIQDCVDRMLKKMAKLNLFNE